MRVIFTQIKSKIYIQLSTILILTIVGCKSVDNFDAFSIFGEDHKTETDDFRRYSQSRLNQAPLVEFVIDKKDNQSIGLDTELKKTFDYVKIPYETIEIKKWDSAYSIRPTTRVICMAGTAQLSDRSIERLFDFVANGGTLYIPFSAADIRMSYLFGFKYDADYKNDIESKGIHFTLPILPGQAKLKVYSNTKLYGFSKDNFKKDITVLANSISDPSQPVIIKNKVGAGHVILVNSQSSFQKRDRGYCFASILTGLEGIPYPIANTSTIFLDDFPCPMFNIKAEPIASEMNLGQADYVKKVWWPDMKRLAKKYNISYSVMLTFDYKNKVEPPFVFDQWDKTKVKFGNKIMPLSDYFVYDSAKNGHELALHGYNHVEYLGNLWKNQDFVGVALNSVKKKWDVSNFGKLPVTYVPPSNYIDDRGIDKLKAEMPSLKYLCSSYNGETATGENREFDFDPFNKGFFDYPRISYGFYLDEENKYTQCSAYLYTGIWTHFLHPDDVYQIKTLKNKSNGVFELRNYDNLGWYKTKGSNRSMYTEWDNLLNEMSTNYPQIRFLNAGEAANIVLDWRASNFKHSAMNGTYTVEELHPELSISDEQYWFCYVSSKNSKKMEKAFKEKTTRFTKTPFLEGYLYCLFTNKTKLNLPDLKFRTSHEEIVWEENLKKIKNEYLEYQRQVELYHKEESDWDALYQLKFKKEVDSLKQRMLSQVKIDSATWNRYTRYVMWEDKGLEVWGLLEEHCKKYPLPENIMYSKELNKFNDYPDDIVREKWLFEQIKIHPEDHKTLIDYLDSYYSPENYSKIKTVFEHLIKIDHSFDVRLQYLQFLILYEPEVAKEELDKIQPSEQYKIIASDITWMYADDNQLKKAYEWSVFSPEIDFLTKMMWLIEIKEFKLLEQEYEKYIMENDDYQVKAVMADYYYSVGRFEEAWILANSLPESPEKENLKAMLNKDVIYVETNIQQKLINNYPELFDLAVKNELIRTNRLETGNFWAYNNSLESNRQYLSAFKNVFSYNFYNKSTSLNSFAFTFSKMYSLKYEIDDPDNVTHNVYGLQYQYNSPKAVENWKYWTRVRGEYSDFESYYFHFGAGVNFSKNTKYTSAELKISPFENGPSYSKNIYWTQFNFYHNTQFFKKINASLALEGNMYSSAKPSSKVITNDSYEGNITGKAIWDNQIERKSKFLPLIEMSYLRSSIGETNIDLSQGYPYWIIPERFYAGGGLGWKYMKKDFTALVEASWFYDTYSDDFKRYIGNLTYQIFDYTALTANFEMYHQTKFYSNVIQFGVKYNMKKKVRK